MREIQLSGSGSGSGSGSKGVGESGLLLEDMDGQGEAAVIGGRVSSQLQRGLSEAQLMQPSLLPVDPQDIQTMRRIVAQDIPALRRKAASSGGFGYTLTSPSYQQDLNSNPIQGSPSSPSLLPQETAPLTVTQVQAQDQAPLRLDPHSLQEVHALQPIGNDSQVTSNSFLEEKLESLGDSQRENESPQT